MDKTEVVRNTGSETPEAAAAAQAEYDAEWARLDKAEGIEKKPDTDPPVKDADTDLPAGEIPAAPDVSTDKGEDKSDKYGTVKSMEKALDDTKTYAHRLEAERADLTKKLAELQQGGATKADVAEAAQAVKTAQDDLDAVKARVYEDYPELQALLDPIMERNKALESKVLSLETTKAKESEADQKKTLIDNFNKNVKPEVIKVHADFETIMQSEEYWKWAEKQRPALRVAAMDSPDPEDIKWAVGEYKKGKATSQVPGIREKEAADREKRLKNSATLRGGSTSFPAAGQGDKNPDVYDWDGAGELLKKQGIGAG
jgi:hypothetical protein